MAETPAARPARQKLSFTLAQEESTVAKTVAVDPHLFDGPGSVEHGKVPPSHDTKLRRRSSDVELPQVEPRGSPAEEELLQAKPPPTTTLDDLEFNPRLSEWSTQEACDWLEKTGFCGKSGLQFFLRGHRE